MTTIPDARALRQACRSLIAVLDCRRAGSLKPTTVDGHDGVEVAGVPACFIVDASASAILNSSDESGTSRGYDLQC